jgi:hypothetical protein
MSGVARASAGAWHGLRVGSLADSALAEALAAPERACAASSGGSQRRVRWAHAGGRRVVVKEFAAGLAGALIALLRGSPARRGWQAGHGLAALGIGAAVPLAYVERRRMGLVFRSALVLEDLAPASAADAPAPGLGAEERLGALLRLALALHAAGATHRDLVACNILLVRTGDALAARLVDLEDVRVPRRLGDAARLRALAQLNASLPDWIEAPPRQRAFERYASRLPFGCGPARALARIVRLSLARQHHWSVR